MRMVSPIAFDERGEYRLPYIWCIVGKRTFSKLLLDENSGWKVPTPASVRPSVLINFQEFVMALVYH